MGLCKTASPHLSERVPICLIGCRIIPGRPPIMCLIQAGNTPNHILSPRCRRRGQDRTPLLVQCISNALNASMHPRPLKKHTTVTKQTVSPPHLPQSRKTLGACHWCHRPQTCMWRRTPISLCMKKMLFQMVRTIATATCNHYTHVLKYPSKNQRSLKFLPRT